MNSLQQTVVLLSTALQVNMCVSSISDDLSKAIITSYIPYYKLIKLYSSLFSSSEKILNKRKSVCLSSI